MARGRKAPIASHTGRPACSAPAFFMGWPLMHITSRRQALHALAACGLSAAWPSKAAAPWPQAPLRLIVGFTPGSSPDQLARLLAEPLSQALHQAVVVENKPGAAGNLGAEAVAKAVDGHTLGLVPNGPLTSSPHLFPQLGYTAASFTPITLVASAPLLLVASKQVPFESPAAFMAAARQGGNRWNYGSVGIGSAGHLGMEFLRRKTGFDAVHVPYAGAPQVLTALVSGEVQMAILPLGPSLPLVRAGRVAGVALTSASRSTLAPEFAPLADAGVGGVNIEVWNGVVLPARAPADQAERLAATLGGIIRSPAIRQKLFDLGWRAEGTAPQALRQRMQDDAATYGALIRSLGLRL